MLPTIAWWKNCLEFDELPPEDSLSFTALATIRTLSVKWRRVIISSFLSRVSDCGKFAYDIIKPWPYLGANVFGYPNQSRYSHHEIGPKAYLAPASREITTLIERIPTMWLLASWFEAVWSLPLWSSYFFWVGMDWFGSQVLSALMYFCYSMASAMNTGRSFALTSVSKIICYNI